MDLIENVTVIVSNAPFSGEKQISLKVEMGEPLPGFIEIGLTPHEATELADQLRKAADE